MGIQTGNSLTCQRKNVQLNKKQCNKLSQRQAETDKKTDRKKAKKINIQI